MSIRYVFHRQVANGLRYRLVGGTRQCHFGGANSKPCKLPENAQTPTSRVHAVLGGSLLIDTYFRRLAVCRRDKRNDKVQRSARLKPGLQAVQQA
jgi:hypothetical protein